MWFTFTYEFYQTLVEEVKPILHKLSENRVEGNFPTYFSMST